MLLAMLANGGDVEFLRFNGHSDYLLDFNFLSMWRSVFAEIGGARSICRGVPT